MTTKQGGYENLLVYWLATVIYDLTFHFCNEYIDKRSRTHDQMIQAARSGKQNIVEGSLEKSVESNIKLTGVARASFGELLEDYRDYLRQRNFPIWSKDHPNVIKIRKHQTIKDETMTAYKEFLSNPTDFANLVLCLCYKEGYLLDQLLRSQEQTFVEKGGFRENLFKKRLKHKRAFNS